MVVLFNLILGKGKEESNGRALQLLSLLKEAEHLTKQRNVQHTNEVVMSSQFI
jgi:hypothetical protein